MSEGEDHEEDFDHPWDKLHSEFEIEGEEGNLVEYDVEGAELGERVYKALAFEQLLEKGEMEMDWVIESFTLMRLYRDISEIIDGLKGKENWEKMVRLITADQVVLFFTLSDEFVSGLSGQILNEQVVSPERRNQASLKVMRNMDHESQMDMLYYSGLIDSGLKGELTNIHKTRNKLIHDLRKRHFLEDLNDLESRLDRALNAVNSLHEKAEGFEAYTDL